LIFIAESRLPWKREAGSAFLLPTANCSSSLQIGLIEPLYQARYMSDLERICIAFYAIIDQFP